MRQLLGYAGAGLIVAALVGCQADREPFESGATLETPPQVEEAPATPLPPQGVQRGQPGQPEPGERAPMTPADTLPAGVAPADTLQPGAPPQGTPR